ncbi:MAG: RNA polymerase sigma factor [Acidimicrobiia bacterium]
MGVTEPDGGWETIVRRARRGDPLAVDALVRALSPYVGRICGAVALDHGDDAAQETFIAVLRALPGLREPAALHGWVRRIAVREAVRVASRARRDVPVDPTDEASPAQRLVQRAPDTATDLDVRATLTELSPEHRAVLVMRDLEGWSEREVAEALAVAPGTAKSRLSRARSAFARRWAS